MVFLLNGITIIHAFGQADPLGGTEAAAAALGSSLGSGEQEMEDQGEEYDEEMDDEMDDEDEEEELALQQPAVHDVHVGTQAAEAVSTSGREAVAAVARCDFCVSLLLEVARQRET